MAVFPYAHPFLSVDEAEAGSEILGPVYEVTWSRGVDPRAVEIRGMAQVAKSGGTDPTVKATVMASVDAVHWWDLQLAFEMNKDESFRSQTGPTLKGIRYIRGKLTVTGAPALEAKMLMAASHPFRLRQVA